MPKEFSKTKTDQKLRSKEASANAEAKVGTKENSLSMGSGIATDAKESEIVEVNRTFSSELSANYEHDTRLALPMWHFSHSDSGTPMEKLSAENIRLCTLSIANKEKFEDEKHTNMLASLRVEVFCRQEDIVIDRKTFREKKKKKMSDTDRVAAIKILQAKLAENMLEYDRDAENDQGIFTVADILAISE